MKILLYGETDKIGSGAWCYAETIRNLGYSLVTYSDELYFQKYKFNFLNKVFRKLNGGIPMYKDLMNHNENLLINANQSKPDLIIILKGLFIFKETIEKLKSISPYVININHDDFFSLNKYNKSNIQFNAISAYDSIFVTRLINLNEIMLINKNTFFFPFSYYHKLHHWGSFKKEFNYDVIFIGTYEKERCKLLENLVIQIPNLKLGIYGEQWGKVRDWSPLKKFIKSKNGLWGQMFVDATFSSKISLGFLRKENRDEYTQRSLEIPACGGLLLAESSSFHKKLYIEDKEASFFDPENVQTLVVKINQLLSNEKNIENIKINGHFKVNQSNMTYEDRIKQLIKSYKILKR